MNKEKEIVDLVPCSDGTYSIKEEKKKTEKKCPGIKPPQPQYSKENMNQFFMGMDAGIDFVANMEKRVKKLMKFYK